MEYLDIYSKLNPSDRLWQRLGYTLLGVVPKVARLKGIEVQSSLPSTLYLPLSVQGLVDAKQYYYDLTTVTEFKK